MLQPAETTKLRRGLATASEAARCDAKKANRLFQPVFGAAACAIGIS